MNRRSATRATILTLLVTAGAIGMLAFFPQPAMGAIRWLISAWPVITPPPPLITAPRGELPVGVVGLQAWVQEPGKDYVAVGTSGFILELDQNRLIGVTTAHGLPNRTLERVALGLNGPPWLFIESDTFYGLPGSPYQDNDLTVDFALLKIDAATLALALSPDPRGLPQPGERVTLFSGLRNGQSAPPRWEGTVQSATATEVLIYMDAAPYNPGGMSGSPVISQHTGKVVGMVIRGTLRRSRWLIGLHPISHLVEAAKTAREFPRIAEIHR